MVIVETVLALRTLVGRARKENKKVALVATMGNLHEGHIALVDVARQQADFVVATIFDNPLQFGHTEDLEKYPGTPEADKAKLKDAGCDLLFLPDVAEMYIPRGLRLNRLSVFR
jgi:pantoate--beta-alanine ligase